MAEHTKINLGKTQRIGLFILGFFSTISTFLTMLLGYIFSSFGYNRSFELVDLVIIAVHIILPFGIYLYAWLNYKKAKYKLVIWLFIFLLFSPLYVFLIINIFSYIWYNLLKTF